MNRFTIIVLAVVSTAAGCNGILGIEESTVDPNFGKAPTPDASSAPEAAAGDSAPGDAAPADAAPVPLCEDYCTRVMENCTGANQQYVRKEVCLDMCPLFEPGAPNADKGNTSNCRLEHAKLAKSISPIVHCPHAGPIGFGTCGTNCESFCLVAVSFCDTAPKPYANEAECRTICEADAGADGGYRYTPNVAIEATQSGNTLNCRAYHIQAAMERGSPTFKTQHCPHTAKISDTCK